MATTLPPSHYELESDPGTEEEEIIEGSDEDEEELIEEDSSQDERSGKDLFASDLSDSEDDGIRNVIGNIPLEWYDEHDHIGYDKDGNKFMRPARPDLVQQFLDIQEGKGLRTVWDDLHGESVEFTPEQMQIVKNIQKMKYPHASFDPYPEYNDYFSSKTLTMPVKCAPPKKSSFTPSKSQAKMVLRYVKAIRSGQLQLLKPKTPTTNYLLWDDSGHVIGDVAKRSQYIPPPKPALPGHVESYNPPEEFIPTEQELAEWAMLDPEKRPVDFIPRKYTSLRTVPQYMPYVEERFERCMDLYLCPRLLRKKTTIDPASLLPELPSPKDLRPYPQRLLYSLDICSNGVRSVDVHSAGLYMAVGDVLGFVTIVEVISGRKVLVFNVSIGNEVKSVPVTSVKWMPNTSNTVLAMTIDDVALLIELSMIVNSENKSVLPDCSQANSFNTEGSSATWTNVDVASIKITSPIKISRNYIKKVILIKPSNSLPIDSVVWHKNGSYFATLSGPNSPQTNLLIHRLSKIKSIKPFKNVSAKVVDISFHPTRPLFFLCTNNYVRIFDVAKSQQTKKLITGSNNLTSLAVHSSGNHVIVSSMDKGVLWFDLELSDKPFKQLQYHKKGVRAVAFNDKFPLFASGAVDGDVHVFHGKVFDALDQNAFIVPLKVLRTESTIRTLCFHPSQPWIISANNDGKISVFIY
ncbi:hypothetical protein RCL1_002980 [Eukaryota sp. TZLM3-RCL]